jgi:hypothetical protein
LDSTDRSKFVNRRGRGGGIVRHLDPEILEQNRVVFSRVERF